MYAYHSMVRYKSQIIYIFYYKLHRLLWIILNILILSCFVFTRSTTWKQNSL